MRETNVGFSHHYYRAGVGKAVRPHQPTAGNRRSARGDFARPLLTGAAALGAGVASVRGSLLGSHCTVGLWPVLFLPV
jgi:hypothetical protein